MPCSLYGKLPTKRDFIAIGASRDFLTVWEPWIQASMSASRGVMKDGWQPSYLTAPIWRFWLGADICGTTVIGAFMPSLDGVGRYFPLTLFACADKKAAFPPPEFRMQDDWFEPAEELLMSALDQNNTFEEIVSNLDRLPTPYQEFSRAEAQGMIVKSDEMLVGSPGDRGFRDLFSSMRDVDHANMYAGMTFWWTIGGEGFDPVALCGKNMPDPFLFPAMLTGNFMVAPS